MAEMITLAEAKAHLRVDGSAEDDLIQSMLEAAIDLVETFTGKNLSEREVEQEFDGWSRIALYRGPVQQIVRVEYDPTTGGAPVVMAGHLLRAGRLYFPAGTVFPEAHVVRVIYTAGFPLGDIPAALNAAVKVLLTGYYEDRAGGDTLAKAKAAVAGLCRPHRALAV